MEHTFRNKHLTLVCTGIDEKDNPLLYSLALETIAKRLATAEYKGRTFKGGIEALAELGTVSDHRITKESERFRDKNGTELERAVVEFWVRKSPQWHSALVRGIKELRETQRVERLSMEQAAQIAREKAILEKATELAALSGKGSDRETIEKFVAALSK